MRCAPMLILAGACRYYGNTTPVPPSSTQPVPSSQAPSPSSAAAPPSPTPYATRVEVGGVAGLHIFSADSSLGGSAHDSLRNSSVFGLRTGTYFARFFGMEVQLGIVPTEARGVVYDVWVLLGQANLVFAPFGDNGTGQPTPFLYAGAVLYDVASSDGPHDAGIVTGSRLAPDVGLGVKYPVGIGWGLRADLDVVLLGATSGGVTEDYDMTLSIYRSFGGGLAPVQ